jgi:hypothetical protein
MYGQTIRFDLPLISPIYEPISLPAEITFTPNGLEFRFNRSDNPYGVCGILTVRTDAGEVTEIEIGTAEIEDQLEIGDWGFAHMRIGPGSTDTIADIDLDAQTLDTFQSLVLTVMAYAQGHAWPIKARLTPPTTALEP